MAATCPIANVTTWIQYEIVLLAIFLSVPTPTKTRSFIEDPSVCYYFLYDIATLGALGTLDD